MKLIRLSSNQANLFRPIDFVCGLNVVLADIRLPENQDKDSHNLGKSTVGRLLDFMFLQKKSAKFFLFEREDLFKDFVFFLELQLLSGEYLKIRRSVTEGSKASFKLSKTFEMVSDDTTKESWDHFNVPFEKAKALLDGYLSWSGVRPWDYRKVLGYYLRTQEDYQDVFQLRKFAGPHADWKPFLAHLLGFDSELIKQHYELEAELEEKRAEIGIIEESLSGSTESLSDIQGMLQINLDEAKGLEAQIDSFDFRNSDSIAVENLVDNWDKEIAQLNERKYSIASAKTKISASIREDRVNFSIEEASALFGEVDVLFDGQLKRDFAQLLDFNQKITRERKKYLKEELAELESELTDVNDRLSDLGERRSRALAFLGETEVFEKYKELSSKLVEFRAAIETLKARRDGRQKIQALRSQLRMKEEEVNRLSEQVEANVAKENGNIESTFSLVRSYFNQIVNSVVGRRALLSVSPNSNSHLEFTASLLDDNGNVTSADKGSSYKRLLCVAFDLAVLRAHLDEEFPRFAFHDGVFETLDPRKKVKLLEVLRSYGELGLQLITTTIDSELPEPADGEESVLKESEIVLRLHDEGVDGRLFKMEAW